MRYQQTHGVFPLTVTNTETQIKANKMGKEQVGNLCWYLSLCSVNTSIPFRKSHFNVICIGLDVRQFEHGIID